MFWRVLQQKVKGEKLIASLEAIAAELGYEYEVEVTPPEEVKTGRLGLPVSERTYVQLVRKSRGIWHLFNRHPDERVHLRSMPIKEGIEYTYMGFEAWRGPIGIGIEIRDDSKYAGDVNRQLDELIKLYWAN